MTENEAVEGELPSVFHVFQDCYLVDEEVPEPSADKDMKKDRGGKLSFVCVVSWPNCFNVHVQMRTQKRSRGWQATS